MNEPKRIQRPPVDLTTAEIISVKTLNVNRTAAETDRQNKDGKVGDFCFNRFFIFAAATAFFFFMH